MITIMKERLHPQYGEKNSSKNEVLQNDAADAPQRSTKTKSTSVLVGIVTKGHVPSISVCIKPRTLIWTELH